MKQSGQIYDTCRISSTHIWAPKRLTFLVLKNIVIGSDWNIFLDLRYVLLRCEKCKIFNLKLWQISYAYRISTSYISTPKRLTVVVNKNIVLSSNCNIFLTSGMCCLDETKVKNLTLNYAKFLMIVTSQRLISHLLKDWQF